MRAKELYENDLRALGIYEPAEDRLGRREVTDTRKGKLTLRNLNRLKHIRNARRAEKEKKAPLLTMMYGDDTMRAEQEAIDADRDKLQQEIELARLELERDKMAIQQEIESAELDNEQRQHIRAMARKAMKSRS